MTIPSAADGNSFTPAKDSVLVSPGGDPSFDGLTEQRPLDSIGGGIAQAFATGRATVSISPKDPAYVEQVVNQPGVSLEGPGSSLTSIGDSEVTLTAASLGRVNLGFLSCQGNNSTALLINGIVRFLATIPTLVGGTFIPGPVPTGQKVIRIEGVNDDIPLTFVNGEFRAESSTLIEWTGQSTTPPTIDLGRFTNFHDNNTLIDYNPSDPDQQCTLVLSWTDDPASAIVGTDLIKVRGGTLVVTSPGGLNLPGKQIATVESGGRFDLSGPGFAGNITIDEGGEYQVSSQGIHVGNLDLQGNGNLLLNEITGDFIVGDNATVDGIVGKVGGTVTVSPVAVAAERVNAIINGEHFGVYKFPAFATEFTTRFNLNDGAFPSLGTVQTSFSKGVVFPYDVVVEEITWREDFNNVGRFDIYSNGVKIGEAIKTALNQGQAPVTLTVPGSFVAAGATISPRWIGTGGGPPNNRRMRAPIITVIGKRRVLSTPP